MAKKAKRKSVKRAAPVENEKICALLSYLVIGIIWYFLDDAMKKSPAAKFHVKQGLVLLITSVILNVLSNLLFPLGYMVASLSHILIVAWAILGIINAVNGQQKELFWIGQFAKHFTF